MIVCWLADLRPQSGHQTRPIKVSINDGSDGPYVELDHEANIGP